MRPILVLAFAACTPETETMPFEGPGYDPETGELLTDQDTLVVSMSQLRVRNLPGPGGRFGEHADTVANWLYDNEPEGWVGAGFRNIGKLNWWTLTLWESEESMLEFVVSPPHAAAMAEAGEVSTASRFRTLELPVEELPLTWNEVLSYLDEPDKAFGTFPRSVR